MAYMNYNWVPVRKIYLRILSIATDYSLQEFPQSNISRLSRKLYYKNEKVPPAVFQARVPFFVDSSPLNFLEASKKIYDSEYLKPHLFCDAYQTHPINCHDKK